MKVPAWVYGAFAGVGLGLFGLVILSPNLEEDLLDTSPITEGARSSKLTVHDYERLTLQFQDNLDREILEETGPLALAGDPLAQEIVGRLFLRGRAVEKSNLAAAKWIDAAAKSDSPSGKFAMGALRINGLGVSVDRKEARELMGSAARDGHREAQYIYSLMLIEGDGGPKNFDMAVEHLRSASASGHEEARELLNELGPIINYNRRVADLKRAQGGISIIQLQALAYAACNERGRQDCFDPLPKFDIPKIVQVQVVNPPVPSR